MRVRNRLQILLFSLLAPAVLLAAAVTDACAQAYPARPVTAVIPFAAGGGIGVVMRLVATRLTETLGKPFVIDNRPGAGGVTGSEYVVRSAPDGYTLLINNNHGINQAFGTKPSIDVVRDYTPIIIISTVPEFLLTGPTFPANSVKEFIAIAKSKPGQLNYASAGVGSNSFLMAELFKMATGVDMTHVPYKGAAPGLAAAMGGEVQMLFSIASGALPPVQSGRLKALGISGTRRSPIRPELATLAEQGVRGFETGVTHALVGPAGMPRAVVTRLNQEIGKIINSTEIRQSMLAQSYEVVGGSPEDCAEFIRGELARWVALAKETGIRFD